MPLQIDATKVLYPIYLMNSAATLAFPDSGENTDSTQQILTWSNLVPDGTSGAIPPGTIFPGVWYVMVGDANYSSLSLTVNADGTASFADTPGTNQITSGNGTSSLAITGFEVTIDGRYLSGPGFIFSNLADFTVAAGSPNSSFRPFMKGGLIPTSYSIQQGSAEVANLAYTVDSDGKFTYDSVLDLTSGGPLRGAGTSYLEILGIPVLIDARAAGVSSIVVIGNNAIGTNDSVLFADLVPYSYGLELNGNSTGGFTIGQSGQISLNPAFPYSMVRDEFHGLARIVISPALSADKNMSSFNGSLEEE